MSWSTATAPRTPSASSWRTKQARMSKPRSEFLETALRWTPAQAVMQQRRRGLLAVITYHAIHDGERFDDHPTLLEEMGSFVSLEDVVANASDGRPLPSRPILVTFDDGDPACSTPPPPACTREESRQSCS